MNVVHVAHLLQSSDDQRHALFRHSVIGEQLLKADECNARQLGILGLACQQEWFQKLLRITIRCWIL